MNIPAQGKPLTPRERQAAELAAAGARSREIAAGLGVSPQTARAHLRTAMEKTRTRDREELAQWLAGQA